MATTIAPTSNGTFNGSGNGTAVATPSPADAPAPGAANNVTTNSWNDVQVMPSVRTTVL